MSNSFADLKRNRDKQASKLAEEFNKVSKPGGKSEDDRFWQPAVDKAGNGYAVVRFLPEPRGEDVPFIRIFSHGFKGPSGSWYIENCLSTLGKDDPVNEFNNKLWNSGIESDKEQARLQKRKLTFIANVYIVKDPANPENEGKVKLFRFGKKIFDKINEAANPQFEDEKPLKVFDLWEGANFKIKIRQVEGYRNYDKSEFDSPAPLFEDDSKLEAIWSAEHSLQAFLDAKNFDTYENLKAKLERVLGLSEGASKRTERVSDAPKAEAAPEPKKAKAAKAPSSSDDEDDFDEIFKSLSDE